MSRSYDFAVFISSHSRHESVARGDKIESSLAYISPRADVFYEP